MNVTRWKRIGWLVIVFSGLTAYGAPALAAQPLPAPSAQVEPPPSAQAAPLSAPQAAAEKHATETRAVKDGVAKATWAAAATASNLLPGQTAGSAVLSAGETSAFFGIYAAPWHCAQAIEEAALPSEDAMPEGGELSDEDVPPAQAVLPQPLAPGFHSANGSLYYADRYGHLLCKQPLGAFIAKADGTVFQVSSFYRMPNVPYLSQIDDIGAWVGCEAVSALMGLQAKGYAQDIPLRTFLDQLPRSESDPEKALSALPMFPIRAKRPARPSILRRLPITATAIAAAIWCAVISAALLFRFCSRNFLLATALSPTKPSGGKRPTTACTKSKALRSVM